MIGTEGVAGQIHPPLPRAPRARKDLVLQELGEEGLLYDRDGALVHILNTTALFTWRLCDGSRSPEAIIEVIRSSFTGTDGKDIRSDVEGLLTRFFEQGLLDRVS